MKRLLPLLLVAAAAFGVSLAVFGLLADDGGQTRDTQAGPQLTAGLAGDERIAVLEELVDRGEAGPSTLTQLGESYMQKVRETGDSTLYDRAESLFDRARRSAPGNADPVIGLGTVAMARHEFGRALKLARTARRLEPQTVRPYAVLVDAQIELGRYDDAGRSLQRMVDLKPNLASYSRVSYWRELHGDLAGAAEAMRLAVSAGGGSPESVAYVQTLLGELELDRNRPAQASRAFAQALATVPGYARAVVGRADLAANRGQLAKAARMLRGVIAQQPLIEYLAELGELELARGRRAAADKAFAEAKAQQPALDGSDRRIEADDVLLEADHGSPALAVRLGRRLYEEAPSVKSADALGWALSRAGRTEAGLRYARRALALDSAEPLFLTRAALTARTSHPRLAVTWLRQALTANPSFSPLWAPRAVKALRALETQLGA